MSNEKSGENGGHTPELKSIEGVEITDISIDCETFGLEAGSVVFEVGVVGFNRHTGDMPFVGQFMMPVLQQVAAGLKMDAGTAKWWCEQSSCHAEINGDWATSVQLLSNALAEIVAKDTAIWANSPVFDLERHVEPMLRRMGNKVPWRHTRQRDLRTLRDIFDLPYLQNNHKGVDDAVNQANMVIEGFRIKRNSMYIGDLSPSDQDWLIQKVAGIREAAKQAQ